MKNEMGVWIDYRRAVVVIVPKLNPEEAIKQIKSSLEKPVHHSGAITISTAASLHTSGAKEHDSRLNEALSGYLDEVIFYLGDATSILILGPGAAKFALQKRLEARKLGNSIVAVKTADRMTHPQIATEVRQYFAEVRQQDPEAHPVPPEPRSNGQEITQDAANVSSQLQFSDEDVQVRLDENRPVTVSART